MTRMRIVCATCRSSWSMPGSTSPYVEMELMSQPCPRCEAYTLRCVSVREATLLQGENLLPTEENARPSFAEVWRAVEG